ncbi:unnamed protein product, partial [Porites lobata]
RLASSGDIGLNPGPDCKVPSTTVKKSARKFPYAICEKPARCNQKGIKCNYRLQLEDELNGICTWASLHRDSVPILGDPNLDRRRPDKSEGKLLLDLEVEQEFTCLIDKATRTE